MVWFATGVPPEDQPKEINQKVSEEDGDEGEGNTIMDIEVNEGSTPEERRNRTWLQGALAAAAVAALEFLAGYAWLDGINWRFLAFAVLQAAITGVVAYYHKTNKEKGFS